MVEAYRSVDGKSFKTFADRSGDINVDEEPLQPLPSNLYGRPVEEVDPFVFEDTFCYIAKKYCRNYVYRFSASRSLFIFGPLNPIRNIACRIMTHQLFDLVIIIIIAANCITLGLDTNWEVGTTATMRQDIGKDSIIQIMEYVFLGVYTIEMITKIIAKGFVLNKFSYLRNVWNCLDFIVVSSGYLTFVMGIIMTDEQEEGIDLEFFRTLRVLRAIKTISILPGLRMMIKALVSSIRQLVEVMALTTVVLMIFSLLALELYVGKLRQKCVLIKSGPAHLKKIYEEGSRDKSEEGAINEFDPDANDLWFEWVNDDRNWLKRKDSYPKDEYVPCGNETWSRRCPVGYVCLGNIGENYDSGWTNFDHFGFSMLSTFQLITLDFWERLYDLILSVTSPANVLFFLIVIFLGSFYLLNLMLAVVAMSYEEEYQASKTPIPNHQKLSLHRSSSTFSFEEPAELNVTAMVHYVKLTPSEREMRAKNFRRDSVSRQEEEETDFDGRKRPNLHSAIMTLLGRRVSMDTKATYPQPTSGIPLTEGGGVDTLEKPPSPTVLNKKEELKSRFGLESIRTRKTRKVRRSRPHRKTTTTTKSSSMTIATEKIVITSNVILRFLNLVKTKLTPFVNHWTFEVFITTCIIVNTILLASEHHHQPDWMTTFLDKGNTFFTGVFICEAVIKICALQQDYFTSYWNLFDLLVVTMSIVDEVIDQYNLNLSVIRSMRLLRVFKLAQSWITMKVLLNIIFSTFGALGNLTLVLLIVLYIFAVLGLQSIGKYYTRNAFGAFADENEFPRWNFQDFWYAFMMVFRVLCGEWIEPLWDCLTATERIGQSYKCFLIFLPIVIVGNFIILNLFLALLLNSFDTEELETQREKELEASGKTDNLKKIMDTMMRRSHGELDTFSMDSVSEQSVNDVYANQSQAAGRKRFLKIAKRIIMMNRKEVAEKMIEKANLQHKLRQSAKHTTRATTIGAKRSSFGLGHQDSGILNEPAESKDPGLCVPKKSFQANCCICNLVKSRQTRTWDESRVVAMKIITHPFFEWFILALIFASSLTLCFEDVHLDKKQDLQQALFYINTTFTIIFVLEMLLKWFALGLWNYFTGSWTLLDFFVVAVSLITWYYEHENKSKGSLRGGGGASQLAALKALRTLRALRPLRAISRWQGMKIVVNALMFAIPSIINVLLVCLLFWLIFSIMGVQFFKGKFYKCVDNDDGEILPIDKVQTRKECCNNTKEWSWINTHPNFDNVLQGYLTLFQVATFEGWMEAMQAAVDSDDIDKQPQRDKSLHYYLFFVIFIVFGAFFTLNLFIGVIIDNFNRLKKQYEGNLIDALLTPSQRHYYTAMKKLGRKKPRKVIKRPTNNLLALFYDIALSRRLEITIFIMIFLNMICMGFEWHEQRLIFIQLFSGCNSIFTTIYALEASLKIIGLRQYYFTVPWNLFDFCLVIASILDLAFGEEIGSWFPVPPTMLRIVRVFRIGRVLRLIKGAKGIRKLLFALVVSLPALFNIGALLALITFIYAILGMALFGKIAQNRAVDEIFNFETFMRSCLMLLRLMTAAGWNDVLIAMTPITPLCGTYRNIKCGRPGEGECASVGLAVLYLVSYLLISYLIVINMYIAIILENYEEATKEEEVGVIEDDLEMFYMRWSRYDPEATQFISFDQLSDFLASLDPPLGIPRPNIVAIVAFNLPIARGNKIHCLDILHSLIKHVLGQIDDTEDFRKLQEQMEHKFRKQFPTRKLLDIISSTRVWKIQHNAAVIIQRAWREYRAKKYVTSGSKHSLGHHASAKGMKNLMGNLLHLGHGS